MQIKVQTIYTFFILLLLLTPVAAQQETACTVSGFVRDAETGEILIGATVMITTRPATGISTNAYGFYSLTVPQGTYTVTAQFMGYAPETRPVTLDGNLKLNFELQSRAVEQREVVVSGEQRDEGVTKPQMGVEKVDIRGIQSLPVLMGERDVLKTIQLLPGVKTAAEGGSGFYVRGGGEDQNLILLDEATVYNTSHLLGFFSVFNTDAIKDVTFLRGSMPAEYGGRLSSVLDMKMNDGNDRKFSVRGGIGLIASRLTVEGPLVPERGSFTISGRRTYADVFLKLSKDTTLNKTKLYFYDLNAKANYRFDEKNRVYLSGYFGKDVLGFGDTFGIDWGNTTATLRWNHLFDDKMFSNTSLIYSTYRYTIGISFAGNDFDILSKIQDKTFKQDFQYFANAENGFKFGLQSVHRSIVPGTITAKNNATTSSLEITNRYSWDHALYGSHEIKLSPLLTAEYGVRLTLFNVMGPGDFYHYDASGEATDTVSYASGTVVKSYFNVEPRIAFTMMMTDASSIKTAYGRVTQNLHLLSNSTSSSPTDLWIPNSNNVQPEIADQISVGYYRDLDDRTYEFSAETYYKFLRHQIDYKDGADIYFNEQVESQLLFGKGRAYGIEVYLKKRFGTFTGWIGYTLSRTERKFASINNGDYYPAKQDRTHDISLVGQYQLNDEWSFSAAWVYYTGNAVTFPSGKYYIVGQVLNYYTERNGYRMPAYHRLDIGATWQRSEFSWTFSLYNAYGHDNAYTIAFREDPDDKTKTQAVQTTLFKFIPSLTFNFKF